MGGSVVEALFWLSVAILVYTYCGYPALLTLVARRGRHGARGAEPPMVSVVVAAYNEESCIAAKIDNLLQHDYPSEHLEVLVVSDGSTDRTDEIVRGFAGHRVRHLIQPVRQGKNLALNRGAREAHGAILVFTDANALLVPGALHRLVAPFADPSVGLVSGQGLYGELGNGTTRTVSNAYVRYESFIKQRESTLGFVAAADGALYAMRRELYAELRSNQVHDLLHPIQVALLGRRSAFEPDAFTVEPPSQDAAKEFRRHVRIIAQGFLVFLTQAPVLFLARKFGALWMLFSHRLLRWTSASLLLAALVSNVALLGTGPVYTVTLAGQALFYALALTGAVGERLHLRLRLLAVPYFFCVVSLAGVAGFLEFVRGRGHATWLPTGGR